MKNNKKNTVSARKVMTIVGVALLAILLIALVVFLISRAIGKNSFKEALAGDTVELESTETAGETVELEAGQILYDGTVYTYNEDILTFLVMGIDHEGVVEEAENGLDGGQADAIFLVVMNQDAENVSIITVNRNSMALVDVYDEDGVYMGQYTKQITLQHGYGDGKELSCERTVSAVSRMFHNLPINGYVSINMDAIPALNDAVGGVPVTVLDDIIYPEYDMNLHEGDEVTLTGRQAYWYVRLRNENVFDSNTLRQNRQKQFLTTFLAMAKEQATSDIRVAIDLYKTISEYMVTDIDINRFTYLATEALGYDFDIGHLYTIEGETLMGDRYEEFYVDEEALEELIIQIFYKPVEE